MPPATLLLRAPSTTSLTSIVEKSQRRKPPFAEYELRLTADRLDLVLLSAADEGFESDVDASSIVSSDDGFVVAKPRDTDERHNLVSCVCYTDNKFPLVLVFVIKNDVLVFRFARLTTLRSFYERFTTYKAVSSQNAVRKHDETTTNTSVDVRKTWRSTEDLLDAPKRPERRKKTKAPEPPTRDVLVGPRVRVFVAPDSCATRRPRSQSVVTDRLFGMSAKLRDFTLAGWNAADKSKPKSVIKKDDARRKNDKKVTFSRYATVQVV